MTTSSSGERFAWWQQLTGSDSGDSSPFSWVSYNTLRCFGFLFVIMGEPVSNSLDDKWVGKFARFRSGLEETVGFVNLCLVNFGCSRCGFSLVMTEDDGLWLGILWCGNGWCLVIAKPTLSGNFERLVAWRLFFGMVSECVVISRVLGRSTPLLFVAILCSEGTSVGVDSSTLCGCCKSLVEAGGTLGGGLTKVEPCRCESLLDKGWRTSSEDSSTKAESCCCDSLPDVPWTSSWGLLKTEVRCCEWLLDTGWTLLRDWTKAELCCCGLLLVWTSSGDSTNAESYSALVVLLHIDSWLPDVDSLTWLWLMGGKLVQSLLLSIISLGFFSHAVYKWRTFITAKHINRRDKVSMPGFPSLTLSARGLGMRLTHLQVLQGAWEWGWLRGWFIYRYCKGPGNEADSFTGTARGLRMRLTHLQVLQGAWEWGWLIYRYCKGPGNEADSFCKSVVAYLFQNPWFGVGDHQDLPENGISCLSPHPPFCLSQIAIAREKMAAINDTFV